MAISRKDKVNESARLRAEMDIEDAVTDILNTLSKNTGMAVDSTYFSGRYSEGTIEVSIYLKEKDNG